MYQSLRKNTKEKLKRNGEKIAAGRCIYIYISIERERYTIHTYIHTHTYRERNWASQKGGPISALATLVGSSPTVAKPVAVSVILIYAIAIPYSSLSFS